MSLKKCPYRRVKAQELNLCGYPIGVISCGAYLLWEKGYHGEGIKVAVLDTGIRPHRDLDDNVVFRKSFVGPILDSHGTHVAGIIAANAKNNYGIYGVAPKAKLYDIQILGKDGGDESDFLKGVKLAVSLNVDIINDSIGTDYEDPKLKEAVKIAENAGIIVVCASGNEGNDTIVYPGIYDWCVSVANWDVRHKIRHYSSTTNPYVDICANGTNVISTEDNDGYAVYTGTSMSAPNISGLIALYIQMIRIDSHHMVTKKEVAILAKKMLYLNTIDLLPVGHDKYSGHGEAKYNPSSSTKFHGNLRKDLYYVGSVLKI